MPERAAPAISAGTTPLRTRIYVCNFHEWPSTGIPPKATRISRSSGSIFSFATLVFAAPYVEFDDADDDRA